MILLLLKIDIALTITMIILQTKVNMTLILWSDVTEFIFVH